MLEQTDDNQYVDISSFRIHEKIAIERKNWKVLKRYLVVVETGHSDTTLPVAIRQCKEARGGQ